MIKAIACLLFLSLLLLAGCVLSSREIELSILVKDQFGSPLPASNITITPSNDNMLTQTLSTNSKGKALAVLESGKYTVTISKQGFKTIVQSVSLNSSQALSFSLEYLD